MPARPPRHTRAAACSSPAAPRTRLRLPTLGGGGLRSLCCALALAWAAPGCAGSAEPAEAEGAESSSGGEGATASSSGTQTSLADTLELPSTTLIPVPSSGVPRHQMSAALQELWRRVEEASAMSPPEFDGEPTSEAVTAWTEEHFGPWAQARMNMTSAIVGSADAFTPGSAEAGVAGALVGYSLEEFVIAFRGAPIPQEIAADPELLEVFITALTAASEPIARQAGAAYGVCARTLAPLGQESPWVEWAQYCLYRATEVNEVYRLEE